MPATQALLNSQRWRRLIPVAFITYSFAYLDRSNYSIGTAGGLTARLHITPAQAGFLGGLFFLGYFLFQVPAGSFAERRSVKALVFWSLCAWGVLAALQGVITIYWLLLADRFLLGVTEAVVLPAMLVFLAHWFTRAERGRANTLPSGRGTAREFGHTSGWIPNSRGALIFNNPSPEGRHLLPHKSKLQDIQAADPGVILLRSQVASPLLRCIALILNKYGFEVGRGEVIRITEENERLTKTRDFSQVLNLVRRDSIAGRA
jgi:hypothetical protein